MTRTAAAQIDFTGPFFKVDPGKTLLANIHTMMQGLALEGAAAAKTSLLNGSGGRAMVRMTNDRVADHVIGRVGSHTGKRWVAAAVVQVDNFGMDAATSRSLMAAGSYVARQTRAFSSLKGQIRSTRAVLSANLSAGME